LILHHSPVVERVRGITRSRLGHCAGRQRVGGLRYIGRSGKGRKSWRSIVRSELEDLPGKEGLRFSDEKVWPAGGRRRPAIVARQQGKTVGGISVDCYAPQHCATDEIA